MVPFSSYQGDIFTSTCLGCYQFTTDYKREHTSGLLESTGHLLIRISIGVIMTDNGYLLGQGH